MIDEDQAGELRAAAVALRYAVDRRADARALLAECERAHEAASEVWDALVTALARDLVAESDRELRGALDSVTVPQPGDADGEWTSGVLAECAECGRCTVVRTLEYDELGEPGPMICRSCALHVDDLMRQAGR